jgi:UDP-N-acetylmuramyl pentapeptide phosphotransferase/UDP-N-acetylglucosamine-1-phosphate transferase
VTAVQNAILFCGAALITGSLVYVVRVMSPRLRLLDVPNQRSLHTSPTARGGGAAIVVVCLLGLAAAALTRLMPPWPAAIGYIVGASLIAAVSFLDDLRKVPSGVRFAVQAIGGLSVLLALARQPGLLSGLGEPGPMWLLGGLGLVWCVGLTNAYNFMDGIDGMAATTGLVAGLAWALLAALSDQPWLAVLALLVAASCAGFVFHNWHPARIFMGDVGSAFLGFTFAFISLAAPRQFTQFGAGVLIMWPFLFDTGFTIVRRLRRRENVLVAHRTHLYQRLVLAGWGQGAVTSLYAVFALLSVILAVIWWLTTSVGVQLFITAVVVAGSFLLWSLVVRAEPIEAPS